MPDETLVELQARAIVTQLQTIAEGSTYWYTPSGVERLTASLLPNHLLVLLIQAERETAPDGIALGHNEWLQHWQIFVFVLPEENDTTPVDTIVNRAAQDIEKCLTGNESSWLTYGVNHSLQGPQPLADESGFTSAFTMDLSVHMQSLYGQPDSL